MDAPRSVCREPIPEQHHGTAQVTTQLAQEGHDLDGRDVGVRMEAKIQMHALARGRHAQGRDDRHLVMGPGAVPQNRDLPLRRPRPVDQGPSARRFHPETPAKTSGAPLVFTARPGVLDPPADGLFIPFDRPALRLLGTPAEGAEEAAEMIHMVLHAKPAGDDPRHAGTRTHVGGTPGRPRPLAQHPLDLLQLAGDQFGRTSRGPAGPQGLRALVLMDRLPPADTPSIHANHPGDLDGAMPRGQQRDRSASAPFQLLWAPRWPHAAPPTQSIGH